MPFFGRKRSEDETPVDPWVMDLEPPECPSGWTTGPPDFVGIGTPRSGTSWWYRDALKAHPRVADVPGRHKEVHFFDRYAAEDAGDDFVDRYTRFFPRPAGSIVGEWTPDYMFAPWTLALLSEAAPEARYLVMLRDPVVRFCSEASPALAGLTESGLNAMSMLAVTSTVFHSTYHAPVRRALEIFGRDRVLVLQYERCREDPLGEIQRTQRFLGLEPVRATPPSLSIREAAHLHIFPTEKHDVPARVIEHLTAALTDDVRELTALCPEIDPGLWPNFSDL